MIPVQPVFSLQYFSNKKQIVPHNISSQFYLSWEDGLWDIIRSFNIQKDSIILVPSFFCVDVMNNMKAHGLIAQYYEVDNNLQPNKIDLLQKIEKLKPAMIVLFHAVGITNKLVTKEFINTLSKELFVIEDCVHRVTNPSEIILCSERHILINSFRKDVPLQGSFVFGNKHIINQLKGPGTTFFYSWSVIILWFLMQMSYLLQQYIYNSFGKLAEWFMLRGYDIIGDEQKAGNCPQFFADLYMHLDFPKIKAIKKEQVAVYKKELRKNEFYYVPQFSSQDKGELRGFPIVMQKKYGEQIITSLRENGLFIRAELNDSLWTKDKIIVYLPLGLHVSLSDIRHITQTINRKLIRV